MKSQALGSALPGIATAAIVLSIGGCASAQTAVGESGRSKGSGCAVEGFTKSPTEHIVVELDQPFRVRTIEGVVASQGGDWPEGTSVLFELRARRGAGKPRQVRTDGAGSFRIADVPSGEYCFKATVDGWQSVVGMIIVSKAADPASRVSFEMLLGV